MADDTPRGKRINRLTMTTMSKWKRGLHKFITISQSSITASPPNALSPQQSKAFTWVVSQISEPQSEKNKREAQSMASLASASMAHSGFSYARPSSTASMKPRRMVVVRAESINPDIRKTEEKVVDSVVITELAKPLTAYCRCWRSGTFPLCDGSHVKHNKATGDNVGPLLLKKQ